MTCRFLASGIFSVTPIPVGSSHGHTLSRGPCGVKKDEVIASLLEEFPQVLSLPLPKNHALGMETMWKWIACRFDRKI
tara:strand:- start:31 stop:264 length:234 start_codon:yes stop_codon:yes gene_type:complete